MDLFNADSSGMPSMHQKVSLFENVIYFFVCFRRTDHHRTRRVPNPVLTASSTVDYAKRDSKRSNHLMPTWRWAISTTQQFLISTFKSHAMKARAEAEAQQQLQNKQNQQKQMHLPQQSPLSMALGAAVRLQQQQGRSVYSVWISISFFKITTQRF